MGLDSFRDTPFPNIGDEELKAEVEQRFASDEPFNDYEHWKVVTEVMSRIVGSLDPESFDTKRVRVQASVAEELTDTYGNDYETMQKRILNDCGRRLFASTDRDPPVIDGRRQWQTLFEDLLLDIDADCRGDLPR